MNRFLLVGNANTGKTTLFNSLTKSNEHTGNWHGVTNQEKVGYFSFEKSKFEIVDLPGIYSMTPLSFEEKVATDYIYQNLDCPVINICDLNNIQRNLYLTLELLELGVKVVLVVNKMDKKPLNFIDEEKLSKSLGCPVYVVDAENKKDIINLKKNLVNFEKISFEYNLKYLNKLNLNEIKINLKNEKINQNYIKIKMLENDQYFTEKYGFVGDQSQCIAKMRYEFISSLNSIKKNKNKAYGSSVLDKVLLNKYLAFPIFALVMFFVFYMTFFCIGPFFSSLFEKLIDSFSSFLMPLLKKLIKTIWITDMIEVAIIGGLGSILSFLPQVTLLFFFLAVLEDSGYLSRVAFLFEDIFSKVGLSGKGVYTMLMGFGCSASAILTARNMDDKNAKIKTSLITPFLSCSAKLPIYAVIGGAFFGVSNVFVVFGLYILGLVVALTLCLLFEKTLFKSKKQSFILEFAHLRLVKPKRVLVLIWDNLKNFLIRIGSLLLSVNVIIWLISSFSLRFEYVAISGGKSMLQSIGEVLCIIFKPLGFGTWGATSALIAGLVAKEVVVSSIAIFNGINGGEKLISKSLNDPNSAVFFSPSSAISFLVFCLLYTPCVATLSVIGKELGKKYMWLSALMQFGVAYFLAFVVFNVAKLIEIIGVFQTIILLIAIVFVVCCFFVMISKNKCKSCETCKKKCKRKVIKS